MQRVQREADAALDGSDVSPAQFFVLATLSRRGELKQTELARELGVTAANVSQLVTKLADARFVTRTEHGKAKVVAVTAKGRHLVERLLPQHDAFLRSRFGVLDEAQRRALLDLMRRLLGDG